MMLRSHARPLPANMEALVQSILEHTTFDQAWDQSQALHTLSKDQLQKVRNRYNYLKSTSQVEEQLPRPRPSTVAIAPSTNVVVMPQARLELYSSLAEMEEGNVNESSIGNNDNNSDGNGNIGSPEFFRFSF
jgi:hypothetical protein